MTVNELALECPKCKKQGLVRRHSESDIFECVYCHHEEDLTKSAGTNLPGFMFTALIAVLLTLLVLGV